ncbi:hypothetical protein [Anaplasma marginale]|uniref:hypothetical protein n=1 Tax=Anaplasma marginale TaxID=770 RepID=UPI0011EFE597|nr:hypothetical protein [Anaplasma marginale]TZF78187.1 hypothetical protein FY180_03585 [Anaplasma marginale]
MSELFLSFCSGPGGTSRCTKLRDVLAANPGMQRNLLAVIGLTENGVLKIGRDHEFSGCRIRFAPPDSNSQGMEEPFFTLDTDLDSELSESLARLTPDSVLLTGASIQDAQLKARVSVIVSNAESVQSLFSFIVHIIDSGIVLQKEGNEGQRSRAGGAKKRSSLMYRLFGIGSGNADNERSVLTSVFECYLDYYIERALSFIHAGGYDSNGDSAWAIDPRFLHATLDGRALLHDEITTGILSRLHRGQEFISPTWSSQARHRAMLLSAVLRAINELPQNVKDEVRRDSSTKQRSSINFLCACGIAIYTSEGHYVSLQKSDIRIRNLLHALITTDPARYNEAAGMLALSRLKSEGKKYNKKLVQYLMNDARFASVYHRYDIDCAEARDLLLKLKSKYQRVCDLVHSCGGQPPSFPKFCTCSFFESLLPALERCGGFQLTLPIQLDSSISSVRMHRGTAFGQYTPTISGLGHGGADLLYQSQGADYESTSKFDDVRVRKALIRAAAAFVVAVVILGIAAALYFAGVISAQVMLAIGITVGVGFVLSMVGVALSYKRSGYGLDVARHRGTPMLTLCMNIRDRSLFNDACEQESISRFGIADGKLCMEGRPIPKDKYVAHVLGAEDEVPHGMCVLFCMHATRDGDLELIRTVSNKAAWPEGSTTNVSFTECPDMGMDDCNVHCSASGQWSSRAGHIMLMKTLAKSGRVNLLLSYLDAYVDFMCPDDGRNAIDPKFRTSKQWKLLCRDHAEHDIIAAIYEYCGMYIDGRRKACLEYIIALLQVHDVSKTPGRKSHSGVLSKLQHKYLDKYASNLHRLVNGPEFPFSEDIYRLALAEESGVTFDPDNWFLSQTVPVRFTRFMCADDRTLIYPQGNFRAAEAEVEQQDNDEPMVSEDGVHEEPQDLRLDAERGATGRRRPNVMDSELDDDVLSPIGAGTTDMENGFLEYEKTEIYPDMLYAPEEDEDQVVSAPPQPQKKSGPHGKIPARCGVEHAGKMRINSYQQHGGTQGLRAGGG